MLTISKLRLSSVPEREREREENVVLHERLGTGLGRFCLVLTEDQLPSSFQPKVKQMHWLSVEREVSGWFS